MTHLGSSRLFAVALSVASVAAASGAPHAQFPVFPHPLDISSTTSAGAHQPLRAVHRRLVLIGDSIVSDLCDNINNATCRTFPGGWVASINGTNYADGFVTSAHLTSNDLVVLSSVGGFHSPGIDDSVILIRLDALFNRIVATGARVIVLVPPSPYFPYCTAPVTEAGALLPANHDELCATGYALTALERSWPITEFEVDGPYLADNLHQTEAAQAALAQLIQNEL